MVELSRQHAPTPYPHPAALPPESLLDQCTTTHGRTSGPGGQHRNRVATQVQLVHEPTGVTATAGERRSVADNRRVAVQRLRLRLAVEHREPVPSGEIGSALWVSRRARAARQDRKADPDEKFFRDVLGIKHLNTPNAAPTGRIRCNPDHRDFPSLLAEALDTIADAGWDPKQAGIRLGVSASQLIKLIRDHPPAMTRVNEERESRGLHRLK